MTSKSQPAKLPLHNQRHERFANLVALGMAFGPAFKAAGYKPSDQHASRLARNGKVRARIDWLQLQAAKKTEVTLESLCEDAVRIRDLSVQLGQMTAAVGAIKELGILTGFRVEKRESTHKLSPDDLSDAELRAIAARGRLPDGRAPDDPLVIDALGSPVRLPAGPPSPGHH